MSMMGLIGADGIAAPPVFLLDVLPFASLSGTYAYGLRKLRTAYTNAAINVRRTSDSTTLDIGFLSNGTLDSGALSSFCLGTDGYINTWYDQSGNGLDLASQGSTHDHRIVLAGTIDKKNSIPAAFIPDASRGYLSASFTTYTGTEVCAALVGAIASQAATSRFASVLSSTTNDDASGQNGALLIYQGNSTQKWSANRNGSLLSNIVGTYGSLAQVTSVFNGTNSTVTLNGSGATPVASTAAFSCNHLSMGMGSTTTFGSNTGSYISEVIYKVAAGAWDSTALAAIRSNQKSFFGTP